MMRISELIKVLEVIRADHGDVGVATTSGQIGRQPFTADSVRMRPASTQWEINAFGKGYYALIEQLSM